MLELIGACPLQVQVCVANLSCMHHAGMECSAPGHEPALPFDHLLLAQLRGTPSYPSALARTLSSSHQRVGKALSRLEAQGLVRRRPETGDPQDLQRPLRCYYDLTPAGERALQDNRPPEEAVAGEHVR